MIIINFFHLLNTQLLQFTLNQVPIYESINTLYNETIKIFIDFFLISNTQVPYKYIYNKN